ncbi:MAG: DUF3106 domain-containing protein [Pseudomonadota bacterium]
MKLLRPALTLPARPLAVAAMLLGLTWPQLVVAQAANGPNWSQLSPSQKNALAPLQQDWDQLDAPRKQKWLEVASRFGTMSPQRQERVRERMNEWARLSPDQRNAARLNYQQSKQVSPQDRQARWEAYQQLPPEERAALAKRAQPTYKAPSKPSPVQALRNAPVDAQTPKSNIVAPTRGLVPPPKPVAPSVIQGNPGATTKLATSTPKPPPHQEPGQPKIAATPKQVDRATLLPKTGPQAAGARNGRAGASAPPPAQQGRPAAPGK